ncbi:6086_t:CDS:2 [Dentiscutata erythropus]|uniref:6086_t:CDS:1 n=1 Tax=Dentiscutata erythropus TaxID=1348616 RepID=A0A9N9FM43_9GLOM|nr:6086_t:CDS:2 [Dentiscutata erythropus]
MISKNIGRNIHMTTLQNAINDYKKGKKICGQATYYLALCLINGQGVERDIDAALSIANGLEENKKYEDAWNIYSELTKDDEIKLLKMANCYLTGKVEKDERLVLNTGFNLYNKRKYKEAFNIFSKLISSKNEEISFQARCIIACYHLYEYNGIKKDKSQAYQLIIKGQKW